MGKVVENELPEGFNFLRREWNTMNKPHLLKNVSPTTFTPRGSDQLRAHTLKTVDFPESPDPNTSTLRYDLVTILEQKTILTDLDL
jgi:hypothetical protein